MYKYTIIRVGDKNCEKKKKKIQSETCKRCVVLKW